MEKTIIKNINLLMKLHKKSTSKVAENINLSRQSLYRFLIGESDMKFSHLTLLLKEIEVDLNKIISEKMFESIEDKKKVYKNLNVAHIVSNLNRRSQIRILGVIISETENKGDLDQEVKILKNYRKNIKSIRRGRYGKRTA